MQPRLLLATNNPGKVRELRDLLAPAGWLIVTPRELGLHLEPEESGTTYIANAEIKARAFALAGDLPALADDSGLEVDALGGGPGVHSARYGGPGLDDAARTRSLLVALEHVPAPERGARFRSAIVVALPDGRTWQTEGVVEGRILREPRGANGFGYDPVFLIESLEQTMAELPDIVKNEISHRARAVAAALPILAALKDNL